MTLSFWESFIISAAVSLLTVLQTKLTNKVEQEAIAAALTFLQSLLAGTVGTPTA